MSIAIAWWTRVLPDEDCQRVVEMSYIKVFHSLAKIQKNPNPKPLANHCLYSSLCFVSLHVKQGASLHHLCADSSWLYPFILGWGGGSHEPHLLGLLVLLQFIIACAQSKEDAWVWWPMHEKMRWLCMTQWNGQPWTHEMCSAHGGDLISGVNIYWELVNCPD